MTNRAVFNVSYDIPRFNLSLPGRQNRSGDGIMHITPGMTEPIEFYFGNIDGVPIVLAPFQVKLVFWFKRDKSSESVTLGDSQVILSKYVEVESPYEGRCFVLLTEDDTFALTKPGVASLRWSLFLIASDGTVYPIRVNSAGARYGQAVLDLESGIPLSETIRSS